VLEITTTTKRLLPESRLGAFFLGLPIAYPFILRNQVKELERTGEVSIIHQDGAVTVITLTRLEAMWATLVPSAHA